MLCFLLMKILFQEDLFFKRKKNMKNKIILIIRRSKDYWLNNEICKYKLDKNVLLILDMWNSFE